MDIQGIREEVKRIERSATAIANLMHPYIEASDHAACSETIDRLKRELESSTAAAKRAESEQTKAVRETFDAANEIMQLTVARSNAEERAENAESELAKAKAAAPLSAEQHLGVAKTLAENARLKRELESETRWAADYLKRAEKAEARVKELAQQAETLTMALKRFDTAADGWKMRATAAEARVKELEEAAAKYTNAKSGAVRVYVPPGWEVIRNPSGNWLFVDEPEKGDPK